jgi:hypothetical protein
MNARNHPAWPDAELDPVRRLHVMAAGIPGLVVSERVIPIPVESLWAVASDLERSLASLSGHYVTSFRYISSDGERHEALVRGRLGIRDRFRIILRPGWCWMDGHVLCAGMAAVPHEDGTRFVWAAGVTVPGGRALRPLIRPILARTLARLERYAGAVMGAE